MPRQNDRGERKGITNLLYSQREFYTAKSYAKLYTNIYICFMLRKYNTCMKQ